MCHKGLECKGGGGAEEQDWSWLKLPDNYSLGYNTWIVIHEDNRSVESEMMTEAGRPSVVLFGGFLSVWTVIFNILLCWLVCRPRHSPKPAVAPAYPGRWLVLNFSLAQLLIGAFVVPLNVVKEKAGMWRFGPGLCHVWLLAEVLLVSVTVWSLFVLTLDRFLYVVQPLAYARRVGRKSIIAGIAGSWVIAFFTLLPKILSLDLVDDEQCAVRMTKEHAFTMSFAVFLAPAILTLTATLAIIIAALQAKLQQRILRRDALGDDDHTDDSEEAARGKCGDSCMDCCCTRSSCSCCLGRCCPDVSYVTYSEYSNVGRVAAAVVAVNLVSIGMWSPFYITNVLIPFCNGMCVNTNLWLLLLWLGYSNAGASPLLWIIDPDIWEQVKALVYCKKVQKQNSKEQKRLTTSPQPVHL